MPPLPRIFRRALRRLALRMAPPELVSAMDFVEARSNPVFPKRNLQVTTKLPAGSVLVLAPHPDDEIIGPGATLAAHCEQGAQVTVLYLTDGGGIEAERQAQIDIRRAEAQRVGQDLGLRQVFWDELDTKLSNTPQTVARMRDLLRELQPAHIYTPSPFDTHFDHFATNQILVDALAQASELEPTIYGYEVWDPIPFANYLVDVSAVYGAKERLMEHYVTPLEFTDFAALARQRASVHFMLHVSSEKERTKTGFAEAFLRFDAEAYGALFRRYVQSLNLAGSDQASHLER